MISIITPHFNDFEGLKEIYNCLKKQSSDSWEWLVIDDLSEAATRNLVEDFFQDLSDNQVQLILNTTKTNASVCRNIGIDHSTYELLVFLDSDDFISDDFVANRLIDVKEFVIFKNYNIINEKGEVVTLSPEISNPLDSFLRANFIWQTTCALWSRTFLVELGKFDPNLQRLQDVELFIRALFKGKSYEIVDNSVDFFYSTKPIRLKPQIVSKSCAAVNYLILKISTNYPLDTFRHSLIGGYYYACVNSLFRTKVRKDVVHVNKSLQVFYKKRYINSFAYLIGYMLLHLYRYRMIPDSLFIKVNRYFFK